MLNFAPFFDPLRCQGHGRRFKEKKKSKKRDWYGRVPNFPKTGVRWGAATLVKEKVQTAQVKGQNIQYKQRNRPAWQWHLPLGMSSMVQGALGL